MDKRIRVKCVTKELFELIYGKIYEVLEIDTEWEMYRVIDESGEDYLYPMSMFEIVEN